MTAVRDSLRFAIDSLRDATEILENALGEASAPPPKPIPVETVELTYYGQTVYVGVRVPGMKFAIDWQQPITITGITVAPPDSGTLSR